MEIQRRKDEHLDLCLHGNVDQRGRDHHPFDRFVFTHDALPEIDLAEVDLRVEFLGIELKLPLVIGAMTGGTPRAALVNRRLAQAAASTGIAFALGSQRAMLLNPQTLDSYAVKKYAPHLPLLFGNLGAVQLNHGVDAEALRFLIERVECDAFNFHLNPLQEAIQSEGDRNFKGLIGRLSEVIPQLGVPVFLKEVGAGISERTALKIRDSQLPIAGIETAGTGGTSWAKVEAQRAQDPAHAAAGQVLAHWGIPTPESTRVARRIFPDLPLIGSGGLRHGLDLAKVLACGADLGGLALPFLQAAEESTEAVIREIEALALTLKTILFVLGCRRPSDLRHPGLLGIAS